MNKERLLRILLKLILGISIALAVSNIDWGLNLNYKFFDFLYRHKGTREPNKDIAIILLDDKTIREHKSEQIIPSNIFIEGLRNLCEGHPSVIGLDMELNNKMILPDGLSKIDDLINKMNCTVLVAMPMPSYTTVPKSLPKELHTEPYIYDNLKLDGNSLKTYELYVRRSTPYYFSADRWLNKAFAFRAVEIHTGKNMVSDPEKWYEFIINYAGPPNTYDFISFIDVAKGRIGSNFFRNKIVFIGLGEKELYFNYVRTPYSKGRINDRKNMLRSEVHANIADTLLKGIEINKAYKTFHTIFIHDDITKIISLFLCIFTVFVLFGTTPVYGILIVFCQIVLLLFVSLISLKMRIYINMLPPIIGIASSYYLLLPFKLGQEFRKRWRLQKESKLLLQVEKMKRMAAIGQAAAILTHDIRKPFSSIKALLSMLEKIKDDPAALKSAKKDIEKSMKNVENMMLDITDFSREVRLETAPVSLVNLLDFCIRQGAQDFRYLDISFQYDIANEHKLLADEERLARVLLNIIVNSFEAINIIGGKTEGKISFESRDIQLKDKNYVEIIISNDGPPFDEEALSMLFKEFFTKRKGKGTGLGLASAYKIVSLHEGHIEGRNKPDKNGVEFIIQIPAAADKVTLNPDILPGSTKDIAFPEKTPDDREIDASIERFTKTHKRIKILLLEDEALYRASLRNTIERSPELSKIITLYETHLVEDALKLVEQEEITHAIVDIDLNYSKTGYDFLEEAKERFPDLKSMVHSNRILPTDREKVESLGARKMVPKPLAIVDLIMFLEETSKKEPDLRTGKTILYADDERIMRLNMEMMVKEIDPNTDIHLFNSAEDLLRELLNIKTPDVIFTDHNMGNGMKGLELILELRKRKIKCPVYMVSNTARESFEKTVEEAGGNGFFESPIKKEDLARLIRL